MLQFVQCLHDTYHHQPVDSEFVEGLSKAEVVEAEEDGPEEADADHREEPVLAVHVGGGGAHDAEEGEDLNTGRLLKVSFDGEGSVSNDFRNSQITCFAAFWLITPCF